MIPRYILILIVLLAQSTNYCHGSEQLYPGEPDVIDADNSTACGPIACYVAAKAMGVSTSLSEVINKCKWKSGELTTLNAMHVTLQQYNDKLISTPTRLSPESLHTLLFENIGVAILAIRKNSGHIDHSLVAVGLEEGDRVVLIDYPELSMTITFEELVDKWEGLSLVVTPVKQPQFGEMTVRRGLLTGACVLTGYLGVWLFLSIGRTGRGA